MFSLDLLNEFFHHLAKFPVTFSEQQSSRDLWIALYIYIFMFRCKVYYLLDLKIQ